ncbi:MAG: excinuclease ABC subunit UvrA [Deltaproteobacteria bacterium]|nr:excinuclease ABC subunit UvrA [Deltaproteobacteria bacterium]
MAKKLVIAGAREHNLKDITVEIPRDTLTVITGVSGSGKSSLAFDTIYVEGQRRYVESLSAYARQFLGQFKKPDVDRVEGLSPAISIEQKSVSKNPRSTVGTATEIYDYLRVLYARIGKPYCYQCGRPINPQTIEQMIRQIETLPAGSRLILLAPVISGKKGEHKRELDKLRKMGFVRARVNGEIRDLEEEIELDRYKTHTIEAVVDRLVMKEGITRRLRDSLETALKLSEGIVRILVNNEEELVFSERLACIHCGISYPEITPRTFSFNSPYGACPACGGLGTKEYFDPNLVVPDPTLSIREGAIAPWQRRHSFFYYQMIEALADHYKFDIYQPFHKLPKKVQQVILYGSGDETIRFFFDHGERRHFRERPFEGVIPRMERIYRETESDAVREEIRKYMNFTDCPVCKGTRLKKEALAVLVDGKSIADLTALSLKELLAWIDRLHLTGQDAEIARGILKEIRLRLKFLTHVGLDYLSLNRASATLSGGEGQRIRLATQIGSGLMGVLYVLDEPSIGLHQRDNLKLLETLKNLRDLGNTVIVVEHDEQTIRSADYVVDMGPGAGRHGGEVVFAGPPDRLIKSRKSLTGKYLSGKLGIPIPKRRKPDGRYLILEGASEHNLKNITLKIPIGCFTCITGVSGSGKSTLVIDTLYRALQHRLMGSRKRTGKYTGISGVEYIDKVIHIDQSPIGRTPRSNPATYTGVFTHIRELFAALPESRMMGYTPGRFSFNVRGGRCEVCKGEGIIKIEMHFLPDVYIPCETCKGKRYNEETLDIRYKGKNIAEVLDMTVNEACEFFAAVPSLKAKLELLRDVGMGYIHLGQPATTLSGGEAQRIKLSRELGKRATGRTLYILDEPTTGLHLADIEKLLYVLDRLVAMGNTVVVIEHQMDVIKSADHIIDLGPEGGDRGGEIVAEGTPEEIGQIETSYTGQFLREILGKIRDDHKRKKQRAKSNTAL